MNIDKLMHTNLKTNEMDNCNLLGNEKDIENIDKSTVKYNSGVNFGHFPLYEFKNIKIDNYYAIN